MGEVVDDKIISADEIIDAIKAVLTEPWPSCFEYRVYAAGSGFPDDLLIKAYDGTGVKVVCRDWSVWKDGKKVEG